MSDSCEEFCRGCEICDPDETKEEFCDVCDHNKEICLCSRSSFFKENGLDEEVWKSICVNVPFSIDGEFYFKLEFIGNKHYIEAKYKDDIIAWMKLTEKLFL